MQFLRPLIYQLINPPIIGGFFLFLAYALGKYNSCLSISRFLWILGGSWFFIVYFTPLPHFLLSKLEFKFPSLLEPPKLSGEPYIIILANDFTLDPRLTPSQQLGLVSSSRLMEGVRLFRAIPNARLVVSGPVLHRDVSQAHTTALAAMELGVPEDKIVFIYDAVNTFEEASNFKETYGLGEKVILVSSASHMPRAYKIFTDLGLDVTPAPTDYICKEESLKSLLFQPGLKGAKYMGIFLKEQIGSFYASSKMQYVLEKPKEK